MSDGCRQLASAFPAGRALLVLVMTVLIGLVGMHGLAAMPVVGMSPMAVAGTVETGHPEPSHAQPHQPGNGQTALAQEEASSGLPCHHHSTGGHADHTVTDCAATGVNPLYLPPAPPSCSWASLIAPVLAACLWISAERAPPDLAQLQLLRI